MATVGAKRVEPATTNDLTDQRQRFERVLLRLGAALDARTIPYRLVVDDRRGGDRVALVAKVDGALVELALDRHTDTRGRAWLLTQSQRAARTFADAIAHTAQRTSRLSTVQRGCLLTITALARRLAVEANALNAGHPHAAFEQLTKAFPDAHPMVGLHAPLRPASVLRDSTPHVTDQSTVPAYGAVVDTPHGPRAARWQPSERGFAPPPSARRRLLEHFGRLDRTKWVGMAIAGPIALGLANEEDEDEDESSFDLADAADCGCDVTPDCFSCDLGTFDLSGCFDVVPDCGGGLDCVPLDCGF